MTTASQFGLDNCSGNTDIALVTLVGLEYPSSGSSCSSVDFGVVHNGLGGLSGYAWSENAGWISFSCTNTDSCATGGRAASCSSMSGRPTGCSAS